MFQDMQIPVLPRLDGDYLPRSEAAVLGAKNLLYASLAEIKALNTSGSWNNNVYTYRGIDYTVNDDGTVTANGTNTTTGYSSFLRIPIMKSVYGDLLESGCPVGGGSSSNPKYYIGIYDITDGTYVKKWDGVTVSDMDYGETSQQVKIIKDHNVEVYLYIGNATVNNILFKPMLRLGTDLDDTYAPPAKTNRQLSEKLTTTLIKYTSQISAQSFSNVDISKYDGFQIMIGAGADDSVYSTTFVPNTSSFMKKIRVPHVGLSGQTMSLVGYAEVNFANKTIWSSSTSYYVFLYGVTIK